MPISELGDAELVRLYGPWAGRTPSDAAELFSGYPGRWWIAGGWAIEAFTGVERHHSDLDLEVPRTELSLLRRHLADRLDVWTAAGGALRPLLPGDNADGAAEVVLPAGCGQVWVRADGHEPWEYDILLAPGDVDRWEFKRDRHITRPLDDVLWCHHGLLYLRPEVQLLLKAKGLRAKDQEDFDAARPLLDAAAAKWLWESVARVDPEHPWLVALVPAM